MKSHEMNPEVKTEWVAALRSDEYEQGHEVLRRNDKFCCLGVLCEIAVKHGVIPPPTTVTNADGSTTYVYGEDDKAYLPPDVVAWSGLSDWNPRIVTTYGQTLAGLNDEGRPFAEIAAVIEEKF